VRDITDEDAIGICMTDQCRNAKDGKKSLDSLKKDSMGTLRVLKPQLPEPHDSNFNLMWRNVYNLPSGSCDPGQFRIDIVRQYDGSRLSRHNSKGQLYSFVLGVTDKHGNALVDHEDIFDFKNGYLVFPPMHPLTGHYIGNQPFNSPELDEDDRNPAIYKGTWVDLKNLDAKFTIYMGMEKR
jgi:hypothetical protein